MGSRQRIALVEASAPRASVFQQRFWETGENEVCRIRPGRDFLASLDSCRPTQIVVDLFRQDDRVFETMLMVGPMLTRPVVLLTETTDRQSVRMAKGAGLLLIASNDQSSDGLNALASAIARYLAVLSACGCDRDLFLVRLAKIVDLELAKSAIMSRSKLSEDQAYRIMRDEAMNSRRSVAEVAGTVLDRSRIN